LADGHLGNRGRALGHLRHSRSSAVSCRLLLDRRTSFSKVRAMPYRCHWLLVMLAHVGMVVNAGEAVQLTQVDDHLGWGWQAQVLKNDLVTLAVVPSIGGRVMQYDLSDHAFLWVNPAEIGRTYEPTANAPWPNFGGYKSWVAPQGQWLRGGGGWPPSPTLDHGLYVATNQTGERGEVTIITTGPPETLDGWQAKGLSLTRRFTMRPHSTHVRVEQIIINQGAFPQQVANWDATQVPGIHAAASDPDKFWVYFPVNPRSMFGPRGFMVFPSDVRSGADSQWKNWSADNIAGVQYLRRAGKIGADVTGGWIAYVDEREGYTYVKRFAVNVLPDPAHYPDGGATVQVSTNAHEPYMEMHVLGPLIDLPPQQRTSFIVDWYASRIDGPILKASEAGVCKQRLAAVRSEKRARVTGVFGVFHQGTVELLGLLAVAGEAKNPPKTVSLGSYYVSPLEPLSLDVEVPLASNIVGMSLILRDIDGKAQGELDRLVIPPAEPANR
jgi:hypothetical protein